MVLLRAFPFFFYVEVHVVVLQHNRNNCCFFFFLLHFCGKPAQSVRPITFPNTLQSIHLGQGTLNIRSCSQTTCSSNNLHPRTRNYKLLWLLEPQPNHFYYCCYKYTVLVAIHQFWKCYSRPFPCELVYGRPSYLSHAYYQEERWRQPMFMQFHAPSLSVAMYPNKYFLMKNFSLKAT